MAPKTKHPRRGRKPTTSKTPSHKPGIGRKTTPTRKAKVKRNASAATPPAA
jgi:hypothetical protein